jgi:hypothetical protein
MVFFSLKFTKKIYKISTIGGVLIYDLESAHGTILNKRRIPSKSYTKLNVGDQFKFGESTRICILLGPENQQQQQQKSRLKFMSKSILLPKPANNEVTW